MTWVSNFTTVLVEANATRMPSGLSVFLIASEIFGAYGMQTVDVHVPMALGLFSAVIVNLPRSCLVRTGTA